MDTRISLPPKEELDDAVYRDHLQLIIMRLSSTKNKISGINKPFFSDSPLKSFVAILQTLESIKTQLSATLITHQIFVNQIIKPLSNFIIKINQSAYSTVYTDNIRSTNTWIADLYYIHVHTHNENKNNGEYIDSLNILKRYFPPAKDYERYIKNMDEKKAAYSANKIKSLLNKPRIDTIHDIADLIIKVMSNDQLPHLMAIKALQEFDNKKNEYQTQINNIKSNAIEKHTRMIEHNCQGYDCECYGTDKYRQEYTIERDLTEDELIQIATWLSLVDQIYIQCNEAAKKNGFDSKDEVDQLNDLFSKFIKYFQNVKAYTLPDVGIIANLPNHVFYIVLVDICNLVEKIPSNQPTDLTLCLRQCLHLLLLTRPTAACLDTFINHLSLNVLPIISGELDTIMCERDVNKDFNYDYETRVLSFIALMKIVNYSSTVRNAEGVELEKQVYFRQFFGGDTLEHQPIPSEVMKIIHDVIYNNLDKPWLFTTLKECAKCALHIVPTFSIITSVNPRFYFYSYIWSGQTNELKYMKGDRTLVNVKLENIKMFTDFLASQSIKLSAPQTLLLDDDDVYRLITSNGGHSHRVTYLLQHLEPQRSILKRFSHFNITDSSSALSPNDTETLSQSRYQTNQTI